MEPNKLETQFKEKLDHREINPSEGAWDRLDAMLSVADANPDIYIGKSSLQKPQHKFSRLYVAASIIGFLFVGNLFFSPKENSLENRKSNVVIKNSNLKEASESEIELPTKVLSSPKINLKTPTNPVVKTSKINENKIIKTQEEVVPDAKTSYQNESIVLNKSTISTNIDSLLASVENPNPDAKKSAIKINPTALLNQVDVELQSSFREKALNTITKKYKEAKEALANRNNQY